ncbi:MAG: hypothetical protein SOS22_09600 [Absicoccus sp.]|jgi:hypothetical protein|uniref:hypothetical protein n=1 Tax=Absicoccus sp. TaxID=2718527 RepID=UPI002A748EEC|nr:hypothetical protein [Absicoccus sp.]MDY3036457.1 hypothetical protein [Absicoccus sp.]
MIVYDGSRRDFLESVENDTIAIDIEQNILKKMGRHTPKSEFRAWDHSMQYMYKVMNDPDIPDNADITTTYLESEVNGIIKRRRLKWNKRLYLIRLIRVL